MTLPHKVLNDINRWGWLGVDSWYFPLLLLVVWPCSRPYFGVVVSYEVWSLYYVLYGYYAL
jgi:hypothetical protein